MTSSSSTNSPTESVPSANPAPTVYVTCERARVEKWLIKKSPETSTESADDHASPTQGQSQSHSQALPAIKLVGFKAYIVEQWLFDSRLPSVVVVLTNVASDSVCLSFHISFTCSFMMFCGFFVVLKQITVCQVKSDMIDPAYKSLASEFFGVNGSGFSTQTVCFF